MSKIFVTLWTLILLSLVSSAAIAAESMELIYVKVDQSSEVFVIPKKASETKEQALQSYFDALSQNVSLKAFYERISKTPLDGFVPELKNQDAILLIANTPEDMSTRAPRIHGVLSALKKALPEGDKSFAVIPVGAALRLSEQERKEFHLALKNRFKMLFALGGDDVHPSFYGEQITYSKNVNFTRDYFEIQLIRDFKRALSPSDPNNNFIFGICRGAQIIKVALEGKVFRHNMNQDIIKEGLTTIPHNKGLEQEIELMPIKDPLFRVAFRGQLQKVFMYHHQAMKDQEGSMFELAAVAHDGVPEAYISQDGRIVLVQFHPELIPTLLGPGVSLLRTVAYRAFPKAISCQGLL